MLDTFTGDISGSFDKLKSDFLKSTGVYDKETKKAFEGGSFWDQAKAQFHSQLAAGAVPLDAFNAVISPITGFIHAGAAKPMADATAKIMPFPKGKEKEGKQARQELEEGFLSSFGAAVPERGGPLTVASSAPRSTFSHLIQKPFTSSDEWAQRYAHRALTSEGITKEQALAQTAKPGKALADLGQERMVEAGEQAALKGEGRRLGAQLYYHERLKGRRARVASAVDKLSNDKNMYEHLDAMNTKRETDAEPLYKEAFDSGSVAPLKSQFENEFNAASKSAVQAQHDLNAAETGITSASAKHYGSNNVYAEASAKSAVKTAEKARDEAQVKLDAANSAREEARTRLQEAQEHEAKGVKGGIWSPRLQEFLENDKIKAGIREGISIAKDKALAKGVPFNESDFAITGHEDGEPVVSKVPNLRLLDAGKHGLDQILEGYRDKTTGRLVLDKKGEAIDAVRRAYVDHIDELTKDTNPVYKKARAAWAGPSRVMDAVHKGMEFDKAPPEILERYVQGLSESEREGHQIGAARKLADKVAEGPGAALRVAKDIVEDVHYQRQLKAAFGEEKFKTLLEQAQAEVDYAQRGSQILGGSPTARRTEAGKEFESMGEVGDMAMHAATGGYAGALSSVKAIFGRLGGKYVAEKLGAMSDARREELAKLLFSDDPEKNAKAIEQIYKEGEVTVPRVPKRKYFPQAAAAAGPWDKYGQQQQRDQQP